MGNKRWTVDDMPDQSGRVAVVTGGNSGIGYETAKALFTKGATVVVASRSEERGRKAVESLRGEASGGRIEFLPLDLARQRSVRDFADAFNRDFNRLDLLINNAGVMNPPTRQETEDGFELQMGTNHLGHFALTLLLIGQLSGTGGSRVVTVSSSVQNFGTLNIDDLQWRERPYRGMRAYAASKVANMLFTLELQRRLADAGLSSLATAAHPGWTATNLQRTTLAFRLLNPIFAMKPWQGALPTLYAAVTDVAPGGYYGPDGLGNWRGYPAPNEPAEQSRDAPLAARLWTMSEDLVDVRWP